MLLPGKRTTGRPKKFDDRSGRDRKICIRISERDIRKLERLREYYGLTKTDFLISQIENAYYRMERMEMANGEKQEQDGQNMH